MTEAMMERRNILAQICTEAMTENQAWFTQGCRLAEFVSYLRNLSVPFDLKDLQSLPNIQFGRDGTVRLVPSVREQRTQLNSSSSATPHPLELPHPAKQAVKPQERLQQQPIRVEQLVRVQDERKRKQQIVTKATSSMNKDRPQFFPGSRQASPPPQTAEPRQGPHKRARTANGSYREDGSLAVPISATVPIPLMTVVPTLAAAAINEPQELVEVDETKLVQYETQRLIEYVKQHYLNENQATRINKTIGLLKRYLEANFQSGLCVSVHLVGSYASGLASKTRSEIDVYVRLDGGEQLTELLDASGLAEALEVALSGCPYFACTPRRGEVVHAVIDHDFRLTLRPFNATSFPFVHLQHSQALAAVTRASPFVSVFISIVKAWASQRGLLEILGSFPWTILCIGYLQNRQLAPKGPFDQQLFAREIFAFLVWLADTDLLIVSVSCSGVVPSSYRGWLSILDPVTGANIAPTSFTHRETIRLAFSMQHEAKNTIISFKKE